MKADYDGNEHEYTFHAGYDLGYVEGRIRELEVMIELIEELI